MSKTKKTSEAENKRFTTAELVKIFDKVHDCTTALILTDICTDKTNHDSFGVVCGSAEDMTMMVYKMMSKSPELEQVISNAVVRLKTEKILAMFDNDKNKKDGK